MGLRGRWVTGFRSRTGEAIAFGTIDRSGVARLVRFAAFPTAAPAAQQGWKPERRPQIDDRRLLLGRGRGLGLATLACRLHRLQRADAAGRELTTMRHQALDNASAARLHAVAILSDILPTGLPRSCPRVAAGGRGRARTQRSGWYIGRPGWRLRVDRMRR
jgi:hypothetical protein